MRRLDLILETDTEETLRFDLNRVILAGYTGRDQEGVSRHIEELRRHGIPAPEKTPAFYPVTVDRITTRSSIEVLGQDTSGEAEFVLLVDGERIYVAVGSDHTDRGLEKVDIAKSKQLCPKPISDRAWPLARVRDRWDDLILRSWTWRGAGRTLYQEAALASLMEPEALLERVRALTGDDLSGTALYSGTLPVLSGTLVFSEFFEAQLVDQASGSALKCAYFVKPVALPLAQEHAR